MKNIFLLSIFALSLAACSEDSGGRKGSSGSNQNVGTSDIKDSYQFVMNGCDTGKHDFASASMEETKKQLCVALQDDQLNNSCAEPLRQDYFTKKCSGYTWTPKYKDTNPPTQPPGNPPSDMDAKVGKVRNSLQYVLVESASVDSSLSGPEKKSAEQLAQDLTSCGLSYVGPKCLDYYTYASAYGETLVEVDGKYVFYSELKVKGTGVPIAFIFSVEQVEPTVKTKKLLVSKIMKPRNGQSLSEYLKDESNLSPLVLAQLVEDFQAAAWARVQKPRDIRELYHVSKMLLDVSVANGNSYQQTKNKLITVFQDSKAVIVQSSDLRYQEAVLSLITSEIPVGAQSLVEICEGLLNSKSENVQQLAAIIILEAQPNRSDLKPLVIKALNNQRWDIRKKAISALSKTNKTTAEENLLLSKLDDQDEDVRKEAQQASASISVSEQHLAVVKQLSVSQNWTTRREAVKLLSRINSENSIKELIAKMDDQDEDVRKEVVNQLNQKPLGPQHVQFLSQQISSTIWTVRNDAAKLLGKIDSNNAIVVLIISMSDQDEDVRKTIVDQLKKSSLKESHVSLLATKYKSQTWTVRRDVTLLLGKISGLKSTNAMIKQMDDQDEDVRNGIVAQLSSRTLTNDSVLELKNNFSSSTWTVRLAVAKLLGTIKSADSLEALQSQLAKEKDDDVRKQIEASIKLVKP